MAALCHIKHSEFPESHHIWKGRVVFRGDRVKDERGLYAVFSELGSSVCLMTGIKMLDALARMPGMKGEDRDATTAYTKAA